MTPRLSKDPAELVEREETWLLFKEAKKIYRLPEAQWDEKILLFPFHQRQLIRELLDKIKEHRQSRELNRCVG